MLGDQFGVAAGLIEHKDAALGAGFDIDRVVAGAVGRYEQQVWRVRQQFGAGVKVTRQLVARRTRLIGMRRG